MKRAIRQTNQWDSTSREQQERIIKLCEPVGEACRESLAIYNSLEKSVKEMIPGSLIEAMCFYAEVKEPREIKPATKKNLSCIGKLTSAIMQLFFYYAGLDNREKMISKMKKMTGNDDLKHGITWILLKKREIEENQGVG